MSPKRKPRGQAGLDFETAFVTALNGRTIKDLSDHLRKTMLTIFPSLGENDLILAQKADPRGKSDVSLFTNAGQAEISLKSISGDLVHASPIPKFIEYLRDFDVSEASIKTLQFFLYRDGTDDGSCGVKWGYGETMFRLGPRLKDFNEEIFANKNLVQDCLDLALFRGNTEGLKPANWLYHGSLDFGFLVSRYQVSFWARRIMDSMSFIQNPHIGPLHIRPYALTMNELAKNRDKLDWLRLKWVGMDHHMSMMNRRIPPRRNYYKNASEKKS